MTPSIAAAFVFAMLAEGPQRDAVRPEARAGTVSGRVVDGDTSAPLRNARVGVIPEQGEDPDPVLTDADGRFRMTALPPGRYTLVASKPGYVSLRYGARRALDRAEPIDVGRDTPPIEVRLPRGAALSGRLVDDLGEPMQDVRVTAGVIVHAGTGVRVTAVRSADTDDLGEYRIAGLPAGTYVVSARPGPLIPDGAAIVGMNGPAGAPTYGRLYHPSTPSVSLARQIALRAGDDLSGIDLTFRQVRRPRLTVVVHDSGGAPAAAFVELVSDESVGSLVESVNVDAGGSATIPIDPGNWILHARGNAGTAATPVTIDEADVEAAVVLTRGTTLSGRIIYEGAPKPAAPIRLSEGSGLTLGGPTPPPVRVGANDSFTIAGVRDVRQLRVDGLPAGRRPTILRGCGRTPLHLR